MQDYPKKPPSRMKQASKKETNVMSLHFRNRHQGRYDLTRLIAVDSGHKNTLEKYVLNAPNGDLTIDFANPEAVMALNRALLKDTYQITEWNVPATNLCPPIPSRADYLHHLADLLAISNQGIIPRKGVHVIDIGTGANGIYPLIGASEYEWQFTATDINPKSLENFQQILNANPQFDSNIRLRLQQHPNSIFDHIIDTDDWFDLSMCNPPFHRSLKEAQEGTVRKWKNLGKFDAKQKVTLNFGGENAELWCPGGELSFIQRMIMESIKFSKHCFWFTSLISKSSNIPAILESLKLANVHRYQLVEMCHGHKQSRFIAWTFLTPAQQTAWAKLRWK